jgi:hypothetical protein
MLRSLVFSSLVAVASFASVGANAATPERISVANGSVGFTAFPQCTPAKQNQGKCKSLCAGFAPGQCFISYERSRDVVSLQKASRKTGVTGYTQGKFRAQ